MIKDIIAKNRSYRRFFQNEIPSINDLKELVNLARLSPSTANRQPLKFYISNTPETNSSIFGCLAWAGYLKDWNGPVEGERPSAYIVILGDKSISETFGHDPGITAQSMLIGAVEKGLGGCIIANIAKDKLRKAVHIPENCEIILVIALGKPKETVVIEDIGQGGVEYWRDDKQVHHVPKRKLEDIIIS